MVDHIWYGRRCYPNVNLQLCLATDNCLTNILISSNGLLQRLKFLLFLNYGQSARDKMYNQLEKKQKQKQNNNLEVWGIAQEYFDVIGKGRKSALNILRLN